MRISRIVPSIALAALTVSSLTAIPTQASTTTTIIAVGDIARNVNGPQGKTAQLATALNPNYALLLGDLAYTAGSDNEFATKFAPNWGTAIGAGHIPAIAVPGNHEYGTANAAGYRNAASTYGFPTTGNDLWSVSQIGSWTVIGLDSEQLTDASNAKTLNAKGVREVAFLKSALATNNGRPTIVMWHRPRYSTGQHGNQTDIGVTTLWKQSTADIDVKAVLWGHDHDFEPGIKTIAAAGGVAKHKVLIMTIGTGGAEPYKCKGSKCLTGSYGVVKMTLSAKKIIWEFHAASATVATGKILKKGTFAWTS